MKKLLLFLCVILFCSCTTTTPKDIVGTWFFPDANSGIKINGNHSFQFFDQPKYISETNHNGVWRQSKQGCSLTITNTESCKIPNGTKFTIKLLTKNKIQLSHDGDKAVLIRKD
jgi:hypothetical protein